MGLSLNPIKKIWDQVNVADNGRTWSNPSGNGQDTSAIQQLTHNAATNVAGDVAKPLVHFSTPFAQVGKGLYQGAEHVVTSPVEFARAGVAAVTHNQPAQDAALHRAMAGPEFLKSLVQGVPRAAYQLGESINPAGGDVYDREHQFTGAPRFLFGTDPIASMQKTYKQTSKEHGKAYAGGEAFATAVGDVLGAKDIITKGAGLASPAVDGTTVQPSQIAQSVEGIKTVMGDDELAARPKVTAKVPDTPDNLDLLNIKISRVADPVRKAELIAERDARFPTRATVNVRPREVVEAQGGPSTAARAVTSARGVISQYGEGGAEIAKRLQLQRDASEIGQEAFVEKIPSVMKLGKKDFNTFVNTLEDLSNNKKVSVPDHIGNAVLEWRKVIPAIRDRAVSTGLDVGDLGENYFPRFYKDLESVNGRKQLAASMVRSGEATDVGDAVGKIRLMQRDYTRTFGNLEKNRVASLGGYEKTHEALLNYISRSFDRVTKAEQFGGKNEALNQLIAASEQEGFDVRPGGTFDRTLKTALGDNDYSTAGHKASRVVRNINAARSLSTSSITNATQTVNTGVIAGVGRTIVGVAKALVSEDERLGARQAGVLLDHTINDLASQGLGTTSKIAGSIAAPLFRTVEKFNRTVSAIVGKDWGNSLAEKAFNGSDKAEALLRDKLRVTGEIGEKLTRDQEIQASRALTELSQFKVDPQDLPAWVDTPTGKIVAQFRTFGYKQTGFVYNEVLREAAKGNFTPLTRYVLTGVPTAVASGTAKALVKGQTLPYQLSDLKDKNKVAGDVVKAMSDIGAGGIPGQEAKNLITSSNYGNTLQGVAGTVFGPTGSGVAETAVNIDKARQGNSQPLKKEAVRNIPGVGSILSNRIYPSKVTDATTRYFKALDNAAAILKGDKKGAADFTDYVAHSKDAENGKTIQASPAESLNNSRMLFANDKVRGAVVKFEKDSGNHAPSWDLPDDKLKAYMQYKSQYTGDSDKSVLFDQFEHKYGEGSIKAIQDGDSKFFNSLPKGKGSQPSSQTPKYPTFDSATKTVMATYNGASSQDKGKMMDQYGDVINDYFTKTATWTNAMRRAEGAPEKNDYPVASPEVQKIMKSYYALPTHDGSKGGNASRYAWVQANPDAYKKMQDYLSQSSLFSLIGEASKAQFKGTSPSQKLLKDIQSIGKYDIATYTDKDGNTVYGLNPADAYLQNKNSSSSYTKRPFVFNTEDYRVGKPKTSFRTAKINIKNGVKAGVKMRSPSGRPALNKKVALKRSKV